MLNRLSANQIDVPTGRAVYTQWCNAQGGIEADLTVTRLGDDSFFVVTAAASATRDWAALRRACRGHDVTLRDVTDDYVMLGVMGPRSRDLLSGLASVSLDNADFPFGTARRLTIAGRPALALRMTYVGELGWEIYVACDHAADVYDAIVDAGPAHGLRHAGYHAMNTLRLEAGYRHWGHDITDQDTPIEAGLGFAVAWDKGVDFVGRAALEAQRGRTRAKRLIQFRLHDGDRLLYHDEPIIRDGQLVGRTSSGMWSYLADSALAMGYVNHAEGVTQEWLDSGDWQIEVATEPIPASASIRSFYDPNNERVRV